MIDIILRQCKGWLIIVEKIKLYKWKRFDVNDRDKYIRIKEFCYNDNGDQV